MKRTLSMVLVLAMIFSAMLGVMSFAEDESTTTTTTSTELVIKFASLEFADNVYLLMAVDYSAVGSSDGITLKIKNNQTGEESTIDSPATDITAPTGCVAFKYDDIGAKNMGDELTIQAYLNGAESGDPLTYSILEYALDAENLADTKLTVLVKSMIQYGAEAQKAWSHEGTYDLSVDHSLVKLKGGATFADGTTRAIMAAGTTLDVKNTSGADTDVWYNIKMQRRGTGSSITVAHTEDNQTIFTVPAEFAGAESGEFDGDSVTGSGVWGASSALTGYQKFKNYVGAALCTACSNGRVNTCTACSGLGYRSGGTLAGCGKCGGDGKIKTDGDCTVCDGDGKAGCDDCGGSKYTANCSVCGGTSVIGEATGTMPSWFSGSVGSVPVKGSHYYWEPGYLAYGHGYTFRSGNFTSSVINIAKANSVFTMSMTLAGDVSGTDPLDYLSWRNSASGHLVAGGTSGRLNFLRAKSGGSFYAGYTTTAATKAGEGVLLFTGNNSGGESGPGAFVTIHIVFNMSGEDTCPVCNAGDGMADCTSCGGDGKAFTMTYYVGDSTTPVATVLCPAPNEKFFQAGYLDSMGTSTGGVLGYLKSMAVTAGNITDYFK